MPHRIFSRKVLQAPVFAALAALALAACNREQILPGERIAVRPDPTLISAGATSRGSPVALPPQLVNANWSHRNGSAAGRIQHPAFAAAPRLVWSVGIGEGSSKRNRLITGPIAAGGRVFTLDAGGQLSAVTAQGQVAWRRSIVPAGQRPDGGIGGGMAEADGVLYVTTGFGDVLAVNPATGGEYWRQTLEGPIRAAPTVAEGRVFAVVRNDTAYAFSAADGELIWRVQGVAGFAGLLGGASPAAEGQLAVIPFSSGEVLGVLARNGLQVWGTAVTGGRREFVRNRINDITGDPVIDGDTIYASNQSGRTIRLDARTGERAWTMPEGAYGPAWPVGGSVFLLSDLGALVRADAATGTILWAVQLPQFFEEKKRTEAIPHYGPILAGGRLWVASADGLLRGFSPSDGSLLAQVPLPGGAAAAPAIARGVMYVVSRDGRLHAFQ